VETWRLVCSQEDPAIQSAVTIRHQLYRNSPSISDLERKVQLSRILWWLPMIRWYFVTDINAYDQSWTGGVLGAVPSAAVQGRHSKCIIFFEGTEAQWPVQVCIWYWSWVETCWCSEKLGVLVRYLWQVLLSLRELYRMDHLDLQYHHYKVLMPTFGCLELTFHLPFGKRKLPCHHCFICFANHIIFCSIYCLAYLAPRTIWGKHVTA